ncbi:MAG: response regulator [Polyangiaceae bacterium]
MSSQSRTILVVEDDRSVREMIVRALSSRYKLYEATDGLHASELLTQMPPPALLICDVMMPRVDGFSLVRLLKSDEKLKGIPILFLTARSSPSDVMQGIGLGARHYMTKPFKIQDLLDRVEKLVK